MIPAPPKIGLRARSFERWRLCYDPSNFPKIFSIRRCGGDRTRRWRSLHWRAAAIMADITADIMAMVIMPLAMAVTTVIAVTIAVIVDGIMVMAAKAP